MFFRCCAFCPSPADNNPVSFPLFLVFPFIFLSIYLSPPPGTHRTATVPRRPPGQPLLAARPPAEGSLQVVREEALALERRLWDVTQELEVARRQCQTLEAAQLAAAAQDPA